MSEADHLAGKLAPLPQPLGSDYPELQVVTEMIGRIGTFTTSQFIAGAQTYDERYFDYDSKLAVLRAGFDLFPDFKASNARVVLDVGCGSGNATFPLTELCPGAIIHASDVSVEMMLILVNRARSWEKLARIRAFVSEAETMPLGARVYDLVVASSMLHHLLHPEQFFDRLMSSLKPGALCILLEPMKAGHLLLRHFITEIAGSETLKQGIPDRVVELFKSYSYTIDVMCAVDRDNLDYSVLDDKWMFSKKFFEDGARRNGVDFRLFTTNAKNNRFVGNVEQLVKLALGEDWKLPEPARSFVSRFDSAIPSDMYDELASEICAVFRMPLGFSSHHD